MWSAEQNISQAGKGVFHKIPGHVRDKNTGNLYTFFSFLFQQKIRPHGYLNGNAYPGRNATCPLSSCSNKNVGHAVALTDFYRCL